MDSASAEPITASDRLAAAVFSAGLLQGFVRRQDIVRWADQRIEETREPPAWMIDLSLSRNANLADIVSLLNRIGADIDPVAVCDAIYALVPNPDNLSIADTEALAKRLYRITRECVGSDWTKGQLAVTDQLADNFSNIRDGHSTLTFAEALEAVRKFVRQYRNDQAIKTMYPVTWDARE